MPCKTVAKSLADGLDSFRWFSQWRHRISKSKKRGFTNSYLHYADDKINLFTSFQPRSMFHFENTKIGMPSPWKKFLLLIFSSLLPISSIKRYLFLLTYASSRVKRKNFCRKIELQMFLLISGGYIGGPKLSTNMASPYKALQRSVKWFGKYLRNCGPRLVLYNISFSWLLPLDVFQFIFLCRVYWVTVKTKNSRRLHEENHDSATVNIPAFIEQRNISFQNDISLKTMRLGVLSWEKFKKSSDSRQNRELGPAWESKSNCSFFRHVYRLTIPDE